MPCACSDVQHSAVTELAGRVRAAGAAFLVLSYDSGAMLRSKKPVIAVTAVRTGCGKSQVGGAGVVLCAEVLLVAGVMLSVLSLVACRQ